MSSTLQRLVGRFGSGGTVTVAHLARFHAFDLRKERLVTPEAASGEDDLGRHLFEKNLKMGEYVTGLTVSNSIGGGKQPFVPLHGKSVKWYGCGPTVYDAAHMGHARNYITFDVIRRIMEDYFGYNVQMVMNVTDIDDKIIAKANEQAVPFAQVARHWENEFWRNMQALNCRLPDVITRVSEFIPEIIAFIEKIVENRYGYESNGSVYFNTTAFRAGKSATGEAHVYGRMEPWSVNDEARVLEGEGALGAAKSSEKQCALDFALWKKAKEGEPSWPSPWGPGRPGWHIECSAMASHILGFPIDIHSGGIDLRFPHHDNELAQSEAHYNRCCWVKYFLHSGHLHIQGLKMSKSLKNFITIDAMLEKYDARIIRLLVLLHRWDQPMNYHPEGESMTEPAEVHRVILNFFATTKSLLRKSSKVGEELKDGLMGCQKWQEEVDRALFDKVVACEASVHSALCDNFDTPTAMSAIMALISDTNVYVSKATAIKAPLLLKVTTFVHKIFRVFGLCTAESIFSYLGEAGAGADDRFASAMEILGDLRHQVREGSRSLMKKSAAIEDAKAVAKNMLTLCDEIRDKKLAAVGVRLEDQGEKGYMWKELS